MLFNTDTTMLRTDVLSSLIDGVAEEAKLEKTLLQNIECCCCCIGVVRKRNAFLVDKPVTFLICRSVRQSVTIDCSKKKFTAQQQRHKQK